MTNGPASLPREQPGTWVTPLSGNMGNMGIIRE